MNKSNQDLKYIFEESRKCQNDIIYFIQTYIVDFKLDKHQIKYLKNIANGNDAAIDESIANIQELNLTFALWKMLVNPCISIVVMSKDKSLSQKFREMMNRLTQTSVIFEIIPVQNLKYEIWFSNNSSILFGDYSKYECQLCGRSFSILILDDFSSFKKQNEFLQHVVPVVRAAKNNQIIGLFKTHM